MGGILGVSKPLDPNVAMTQPKQSAEGSGTAYFLSSYILKREIRKERLERKKMKEMEHVCFVFVFTCVRDLRAKSQSQ